MQAVQKPSHRDNLFRLVLIQDVCSFLSLLILMHIQIPVVRRYFFLLNGQIFFV